MVFETPLHVWRDSEHINVDADVDDELEGDYTEDEYTCFYCRGLQRLQRRCIEQFFDFFDLKLDIAK